jgi:hypothetical protein
MALSLCNPIALTTPRGFVRQAGDLALPGTLAIVRGGGGGCGVPAGLCARVWKARGLRGRGAAI